MKHFTLTLAAIFWSLSGFAQIGTGVIMMVDDNYQFPGTTVDSIASFEISVHNVVGAAQTVYFSALDAPFSLEDNTPIEIPANDSATVVLQFAPQSLGSFSGSLEAIGSVFGSATFNFSGTGIQVVLDWTPETLVFETTAIGQTATQDVTFTNTGNGLAVIEGIDDPNGLFSVEFVDTYVAPTSPICLEYNESVYHNFYLTVDLGDEYPSTYWYIYDNNGYNSYGGDYNSPADSLELCLPVSESSNNVGFYVQFQNDQVADASMQLEDAFGNVVWELSLQDENYNYSDYSETFYITSGNPPAAPAFTPGVIEEGDSQTARVTFSPTDAGLVNGSIQFNTNSALSPTVEIACEGTGISEVSGEVCDSHWTLANSPFTLVGDVVVPVGCTLEIDPGVEVIQNGSALIILGDLVAMGTEGQPISITGGGLQWGEGDVNQLSYVNRISEDALIEEIYFNSFETAERSYEFDCYDVNNNISFTGNNSSGYDGCDGFYHSSSCSSPLSSDPYSLMFRSRYYDAYLYLADTLIAPAAGTYEISLRASCVTLYQDVTFQLQVETESGWEVYDEILPETAGSFLLRSTVTLEEGQPINFRLYVNNEWGGSSSNYIHIDDVRVGRYRFELTKQKFELSTYADSVNSISGDFYNDQVYVEGDSLILSITQTSEYWDTNDFTINPLTIASDGEYADSRTAYYLSFSHTLEELDDNCSIAIYYKRNDGNWVQAWIQDYFNNSEVTPYEKKREVIQLSQDFNAGERIGFRIEAYAPYSYSHIAWKVYDIEFFQLGFDDAAQRGLQIENVAFEGLNMVGGGNLEAEYSSFSDVTLSDGDITATGSSFKSILINNGDLDCYECTVEGSESPRRGIEMTGDSADAVIFGSTISNNWGGGIYMPDPQSTLDLSHSYVTENNGSGVYQYQGSSNQYQQGTYASISSSLIGYNGGYGLRTDGDVDIDYSNLIENSNQGVYNTYGFGTVDNSIIWFNGSSPQVDAYSSASGSYALSYSNIQGINALLTDDQYAWGDGCVGTDPLLTNEMGHIDANSPCVDGGMPWEEDAHIPMGQGSSRADMGMYGGPDNAYWGGTPPPDGSVTITDVFDIPNDQGNHLGIQFTASPFDFGGLGFNVTHYSVWRDLAVASDTIIDVANGNWEQIGEIPSQGFNQYGYTAETLVNSYPDNPGCMTNFIVVAHTTENNIYWVSDVAGACALDNLAPADPDANGLVLDSDGETVAQIHWSAPEAADYAYTEVTSDAGYTAQLNNDTLIIDNTIIVGNSYTYTIVHADINGNESNPVQVTLDIPAGLDIIPLTAGWNLISTDRTPTDASIEAVFATLEPGNLDYITGFDGGVQFYDPEGLSFLNSLSALTNGQGYWVRVAEDDTLEVSGASLQANYLPALNAGWNIIGFPNAADAAPADYFADFITDGSLEYVTGFDGGSTYFDPNGLSFLNSLTALENGFGYWVKVTEPFNPNGMVLTGDEPTAALTGASQQHANPNFMLVNGTSDLTHAAGTQVAVRRTEGSLVAQLPVLEGGYLMTTALFGDDPSTDAIEGLQVGEELHFEVQGQRAEESLVYSGQMDIKHLELTFGAAQAMASVFPNPFVESLQVNASLETPGYLMCELTDAVGKVVAQQPMGWQAKGAFTGTWEVPGLAPGMYTCKILKDDAVLLTTPVLKR